MKTLFIVALTIHCLGNGVAHNGMGLPASFRHLHHTHTQTYPQGQPKLDNSSLRTSSLGLERQVSCEKSLLLLLRN